MRPNTGFGWSGNMPAFSYIVEAPDFQPGDPDASLNSGISP